MSFFKPAALSHRQIEYRNRVRARGRKHYIIYTGMLRFGMSMFVLMTLWDWYKEFGWSIPYGRSFWFSVILGLVTWPVVGYFGGAIMWKRVFEDPPS